jgi:hypothetical protein
VKAWVEVLDAIEHGVDACESRYIAGQDVDIPPPPDLPTDLGPLPRELEPRARRVLARLRATEAKIARIPRPGVTSRRARFAAGADDAASFEHRM